MNFSPLPDVDTLNSLEYKTYAAECLTWDAPASIEQFKQLQQWRAKNKVNTKPHITTELIKNVSDLFDNAHPYLIGHYTVLTVIRFEWAYSTRIITEEQLDAFKRFWRTPR